MATFVLIPGAGGAGEVYWRETAAELTARGHTAIPVDFQADDPALGLDEYAAITDAAIGDRRDVTLVAQSMGAFTAPMIGKRDAVSRMVFVNGMIPVPGETPGDWWGATKWEDARRCAKDKAGRSEDFSAEEIFLHDVPDDVKAELAENDRQPAETPFGQPCTFRTWPEVPMHVLVGADDRLFPDFFQVLLARERLGIEADVVPGGHLLAKSRPAELAEQLVRYTEGNGATPRSPVSFDLGDAAAELRRVAGNVRDDQLDASTPCAEWTVGDLAGHVCGLTRIFTHAARHEPAPDAAADDGLSPQWREHLARDLDALVTAWREPSAWQGEAQAGGVRMSSADLAAVVLDELVLHTWDLARATGQSVVPTAGDIEICTGFAAAMSTPETLASRDGLYGPLVATPPDASPVDTLLGLTGRDPAWR